jgi:hypothetical protein
MQLFGQSKSERTAEITNSETKLLLVFADTSGSVDDNRGFLRKKFFTYIASFFNELAIVYAANKSKDKDIAVRTYLFDSEVAPNEFFHWVGDRAQNSNFITNYGKRNKNPSYGTSLNKVYETVLEQIDDHATTKGNSQFKTYVLIVCDGGTEDYEGAPFENVWMKDMASLVAKLKARKVTVVLVGQSDVPFGERPRLPRKGRTKGMFYSQIHAKMWARYSGAKGFANDQGSNSSGVIKWLIKVLVS